MEPGNRYIIDRIIGARGTGKSRRYRVSWEGYEPDFNSWQTPESLPTSLIDEAQREFNFAVDLLDSALGYTPDAREIESIIGLTSRRPRHAQNNRSRIHEIKVLMHGEPDNVYMHISYAQFPRALLRSEFISMWPDADTRFRATNALKQFDDSL